MTGNHGDHLGDSESKSVTSIMDSLDGLMVAPSILSLPMRWETALENRYDSGNP